MKRGTCFQLGVALLGLAAGPRAAAYPEMVRHGYVNCTSCHVSPSGGGVLTPYGRGLSKEVLSARGNEKEAGVFHGAFEPPEWLNLGGDVRTLELFQDTSFATEARFFVMQADFEAAVTQGRFTAAGTIGVQSDRSTAGWEPVSRRHYVLYKPRDEVNVRAGRFLVAYGINTPDHVLSTKRSLRIGDAGGESYALEGSWFDEALGVIVSAFFGRPDQAPSQREQGWTVTPSWAFSERYKVGMSFFQGRRDQIGRQLLGTWGVLGFTPSLFLLTEWDVQQIEGKRGLAGYQRLDYEFFQGFHGYLTQELFRENFSDPLSLDKSYGFGVQFFPRPHFEFNLAWQFRTSAAADGYTDYSYFLFHYYF